MQDINNNGEKHNNRMHCGVLELSRSCQHRHSCHGRLKTKIVFTPILKV